MNAFLIELSFTKVKPSNETLVEKIKAVVSENLAYEGPVISELKAFLETLDDQVPDTWMKTNGFLIKSSSTRVSSLFRHWWNE